MKALSLDAKFTPRIRAGRAFPRPHYLRAGTLARLIIPARAYKYVAEDRMDVQGVQSLQSPQTMQYLAHLACGNRQQLYSVRVGGSRAGQPALPAATI
jgi:hypothetical protein